MCLTFGEILAFGGEYVSNIIHLLAEAIFNLGNLYHDGKYVNVDFEKASKYYEMAIEKGHTGSMNNFGNMYHNGVGVTADPVKARYYYEMSAHLGHKISLYNLGMLHLTGDGVPRNKTLGLGYLDQSAELGYFLARYYLGKYHLVTKKNPHLAIQHFESILKVSEESSSDSKFSKVYYYLGLATSEIGLQYQSLNYFRIARSLGEAISTKQVDSINFGIIGRNLNTCNTWTDVLVTFENSVE